MYKHIEKCLTKQQEIAIKSLMMRFKVKTLVYKSKNDDYSRAYGKQGGKSKLSPDHEIDSLLVGDDWFASDSTSTGTFQEGFMYTESDLVTVGDTIQVTRPDGKDYRYKVDSRQSIGYTSDVLVRFRLSAVA